MRWTVHRETEEETAGAPGPLTPSTGTTLAALLYALTRQPTQT